MKFFDAAMVETAMDYRGLVGALRDGFRSNVVTPVRHHHTISLPDQTDATMLLMPSWQDTKATGTSKGGYVGIKMVTVYPDNETRLQKPSILGTYLLLDAESGEIRALMDGPTLTVWRTACASALAADYLARSDSSSLAMIGTGALSSHLIRAHASVRPIKKVTIWGRNQEKASALADRLADLALDVTITNDRQKAVSEADIVSCATMSSTPLVEGAWLKPGAHLDLVGAYRPDMRESDDEAVAKSRVYVDTLAGATKEGGDITQPLATGVLALDDIRGDLFGLCRDKCSARWGAEEVTLFKSVGTALEDLAAAKYVYEKLGQG
ncbi:ornithine cyclodeaminase family protein [Cohaesibacter celericrescens]|uniref:Ornithine cyclodeaminase n=1 Tax=Cohaesibacter celericrescens TaxID=2067669 RepID=A0A2N5XMW9_9HYPH|nr:ornithine cyclodeaminase family protein [Cohaesibacter celericrescens]PLW75896.1 ornithine cyclodeaminase [Cohaesibacter celericrescens]